MTRIFPWLFMWKMDPMSGFDIRLVFSLPPSDSTLQYKKCMHLWNNFPCIKSLIEGRNPKLRFKSSYFGLGRIYNSMHHCVTKSWNHVFFINACVSHQKFIVSCIVIQHELHCVKRESHVPSYGSYVQCKLYSTAQCSGQFQNIS